MYCNIFCIFSVFSYTNCTIPIQYFSNEIVSRNVKELRCGGDIRNFTYGNDKGYFNTFSNLMVPVQDHKKLLA